VKNIVSECIGPDQCVEFDLDSGAVTIVDSEVGIELCANTVLRLAQAISDHAVAIALHVQKVGE